MPFFRWIIIHGGSVAVSSNVAAAAIVQRLIGFQQFAAFAAWEE
jgi:hypothetical protein